MNNRVKYIVVLLITIYGIKISGQDSTFFKIIETVEPRTGREICAYEGRYFISATGVCENIFECTEVMEIDKLGNVLWSRRIPWLDKGANVMIISNDTITITGNHPTQNRFLMHHMTLEGDSLSTYEIKDTTDIYTNMFQLATVKHNGKFYVAGTGLKNDSSFALLYVVNSYGNLDTLLNPLYTNLNATIWDMLVDQKGNITVFIEADTKGYDTGKEPYRVIVKYDDDYNIIWSYISEQDDNNSTPKPRGTELPDGRIAYILQGEDDFSSLFYSVRAINPDSTISWWYNWEKDHTVGRELYVLRTTSDGNIIALGDGHLEHNLPHILESPYLCKISSEGELLWERYLIIPDTIREGNVAILGTLFEMIELEDGSLYIIGQWLDHDRRDRDIFLMHLDSEGCLVPNCRYSMTTDTIPCEIEQPNIVDVGEYFVCSNFGVAYQWLDCDNNYAKIDGANERIFVPEKSGHYAIETKIETCVDTSDCKAILINSIEDLESNRVEIYPNPIHEELYINIKEKQGRSTIKIYDIIGKEVYQKEGKKGLNIIQLNLSSGIYILKIIDENGVYYNEKTVVR